MKYYKNILKFLFPIWILVSSSICQDLDLLVVDLTLLNTSQYTLENWKDLEELWYVEVENKSSQNIDYYLTFTLQQGSNDKVTGTTRPLIIQSDKKERFTNLDPVLNTDALKEYYQDPGFILLIEKNGHLPPGTYTLILSAFDLQDHQIDFDQEGMTVEVGNKFSLETPEEDALIIKEGDLYFQWDTPGFRQGILVDFRLKIAAIVPPATGSDALDAIELGSSNQVFYFNSDWSELAVFYGLPFEEGSTTQTSSGGSISTVLGIHYLSLLSQNSMDDLVCGYDYAWRLEAREVIDDFPYLGLQEGIWGWPEPEIAGGESVRKFSWGGLVSGLMSPSGDNVFPTFQWDNIFCSSDVGSGYEIEIKKLEDPFTGEETILSENADYSYLATDPGLIPGQTYKWKVRINSSAGHLPWSDETGQFTIDNISNPQPQGLQYTVFPQFNLDGPANIASSNGGRAHILITSDTDFRDIVYDGEYLDKKVTLPWSFEPEDPYYGLFPNVQYNYKIILLNASGIPLNMEDIDGINMDSFIIEKVDLESPNNLAIDRPLNVTFTWDGPLSVPGYVLEITDGQDHNFADPQVSIKVKGATSFIYPYDGDYPLENEKTYYWRVLPMDLEDNTGPVSSYSNCELSALKYSDCQAWQFTTYKYTELVGPLSGSIIETVRPTFEFNTPIGVSYITLKISNETDEDVIDAAVYNEVEKIYPQDGRIYWQYPDQGIDFGFHPGMKYYWQYIMYDIDDQLIGVMENYEILFFTIKKIALMTPDHSAKNIPLNQKFTWDGPTDVSEYEFSISDEEDPELANPKLVVNGIVGNTLDYPKDGDFLLEYEKIYYWRVVAKDLNGNPGLVSSYSDVFQFTTSDYPEMGEEISRSNTDLRIPIINIIKTEGLEYTIFIYSDPEGSSIIEELTSMTTFPFEFTDGKEILQYGTTYYIQIQPMKEGEIFGPPSIMMPFNIPEEPEITDQCEISCEFTENVEPEILTTILEGIEGATEYLLLFSENEDMSNPATLRFSVSESQYLISSEYVNWGGTYYTQVSALIDDEELGLPSDIQMTNIDSKPGMNEKTAISVTLPEGSTKPKFEIINEITGATGYRIIISTEPDMSTEFWQINLLNSTTSDYPNDGPPLQYGQSYYVTAQALDGDDLHGIISNIVGFFIPNITPPVLGEEFNWEASIPQADQYLLEVSLTEDFSAIIINKTVQGTTYQLNMDELEYSKGYYWKIQGLSDSGEKFGNPSQIEFFNTESVPEPILNVSSEEMSLTPEFTWTGIEMEVVYQITVASDGSMENILWQENISSTSAVYPESATLLDFATTYYWNIIALDENGNPLSQSSIEPFSTKSVYAVVGLNPDGGTETLTPTLQWEANDKILSYLVILASDAEMGNTVVSEQVDGNSFQIVEGTLSSGANYYWLVDGLDENGESVAGRSKIASLTMPSANSISLISPIGDEQVNSLNPGLKWTGLLGTSSYTLRIGTDPALESIIVMTVISGTETILSDENRLNNSTSYFWQIQGGSDDNPILSSVESFSTPASAEINIQSLEDGDIISITNPVFTWETGEEVAAFSIRFSENAEFSESWEFQTGTTNFEYPGDPSLKFATPYFWQVSPLDNEGNSIGEWTPSRSFSISAAFIVELEVPGNGETATTKNPTLQWSAIEGVSRYEIQVSRNEDFSEIVWVSSEIVENKTAYPGSGADQLEYGQIYYWRVRAMGEENPLGNFSPMFSFDLSGDNKVVLEGPLNEESETLQPYFSWEPVNGASGYTLTLASDESMSTIIFTSDPSEVLLQYPTAAPPLSNGITYYWNVIAKDENGNPLGDISTVGLFSTPSGTLEIEFMFGDE